MAQTATFGGAVISSVGSLLKQNLVKEAEAVIAAHALVTLSALEQGAISPDDANLTFAMLDVYLNNETDAEFSEDLADLIQEGETLHHFGEPREEPTVPRPDLIRELATRLLAASTASEEQA